MAVQTKVGAVEWLSGLETVEKELHGVRGERVSRIGTAILWSAGRMDIVLLGG